MLHRMNHYYYLPILSSCTCVPALLFSTVVDTSCVRVLLLFILTLLLVVANSIWTYVVIIFCYRTYVIIILLPPLVLSYCCWCFFVSLLLAIVASDLHSSFPHFSQDYEKNTPWNTIRIVFKTFSRSFLIAK